MLHAVARAGTWLCNGVRVFLSMGLFQVILNITQFH